MPWPGDITDPFEGRRADSDEDSPQPQSSTPRVAAGPPSNLGADSFGVPGAVDRADWRRAGGLPIAAFGRGRPCRSIGRRCLGAGAWRVSWCVFQRRPIDEACLKRDGPQQIQMQITGCTPCAHVLRTAPPDQDSTSWRGCAEALPRSHCAACWTCSHVYDQRDRAHTIGNPVMETPPEEPAPVRLCCRVGIGLPSDFTASKARLPIDRSWLPPLIQSLATLSPV